MTTAVDKVPAGARPLRWLQRASDPQGRDPLNALQIEEETMHKGPLVSRFAISTVLLLGLLFSNSAFADAGGKPANEIGSMGPVPKAPCGPSDRTESGLQGQT